MNPARAQSIHDRLLARARARARAQGEDFNLVLNRFATQPAKLAQWNAFLAKNWLEAPTLATVIKELGRWFAVPLAQARRHKGMS